MPRRTRNVQLVGDLEELKGQNVHRMLVPAVIGNFAETFLRKSQASFRSPAVHNSSVLGIKGHDSSWIVEAQRSAGGTATEFYVILSGERISAFEVQPSFSIRSPSGKVLFDYGIRGSESERRPDCLFLGSVTDEKVLEKSWLFNGELHGYADLRFQIDNECWEPPAPESNGFLSNALKAQVEHPKHSDFELVVEDGKRIKTHKLILGSVSPVFQAMFDSECQETRNGLCTLPDADEDGIKAMLNCIYGTDVSELGIDLVQKVFQLADKYQIAFLKEQCTNRLAAEIKMENVVDIILLADQHSTSQLKNEGFIFLENNLEEATINNIAIKLMEAGKASNSSLHDDWRAHMHLRKTGKRLELPEAQAASSSSTEPEVGNARKRRR